MDFYKDKKRMDPGKCNQKIIPMYVVKWYIHRCQSFVFQKLCPLHELFAKVKQIIDGLYTVHRIPPKSNETGIDLLHVYSHRIQMATIYESEILRRKVRKIVDAMQHSWRQKPRMTQLCTLAIELCHLRKFLDFLFGTFSANIC